MSETHETDPVATKETDRDPDRGGASLIRVVSRSGGGIGLTGQALSRTRPAQNPHNSGVSPLLEGTHGWDGRL